MFGFLKSVFVIALLVFSTGPLLAVQPLQEKLLSCEATEIVRSQIFKNFDDQENNKVEVGVDLKNQDLKLVIGQNVFAEANRDIMTQKGSLDDEFSVTVRPVGSNEEIFLRQNGNSEIAEIFITNKDCEVPSLVAVLACGSLVTTVD